MVKICAPRAESWCAAAARLASQALGRCEALLVPHACALCGATDAGMSMDLCEVCRESLPVLRPGDEPAGGAFELVCTPLAYGYPVDHFVRELKFRGERAYARVLGALLAQARAARDAPLPAVAVPVPLHLVRYRQRGFNQAAEIARHAARALGLPLAPHALQRRIATAEQSGLDLAGRHANVLGAFRVQAPPGADHVALVDDVVTTGSTAAEAARVLRAAGVRRIELWAAARAL